MLMSSPVSVLNKEKPRKKRVRYKIPTYKKKEKITKNILEYQCNQKHIFRLRTLHNIYCEIAKEVYKSQLTIPFDNIRLFKKGLTIHFDGDLPIQAEVTGTESLPIKERLITHIKVLRTLRKNKAIWRIIKKIQLKRKIA